MLSSYVCSGPYIAISLTLVESRGSFSQGEEDKKLYGVDTNGER